MKLVSLNTASTPDVSETEALALLGYSETPARDKMNISSLVSACTNSLEKPAVIIRANDGLIVLEGQTGALGDAVVPVLDTWMANAFTNATKFVEGSAISGTGRSRQVTCEDSSASISLVNPNAFNAVLLTALLVGETPKFTTGQLFQLVDDHFTDPATGVTDPYCMILDQVSGAFAVYDLTADVATIVGAAAQLSSANWPIKYVFNLADDTTVEPPAIDFPVWG